MDPKLWACDSYSEKILNDAINTSWFVYKLDENRRDPVFIVGDDYNKFFLTYIIESKRIYDSYLVKYTDEILVSYENLEIELWLEPRKIIKNKLYDIFCYNWINNTPDLRKIVRILEGGSYYTRSMKDIKNVAKFMLNKVKYGVLDLVFPNNDKRNPNQRYIKEFKPHLVNNEIYLDNKKTLHGTIENYYRFSGYLTSPSMLDMPIYKKRLPYIIKSRLPPVEILKIWICLCHRFDENYIYALINVYHDLNKLPYFFPDIDGRNIKHKLEKYDTIIRLSNCNGPVLGISWYVKEFLVEKNINIKAFKNYRNKKHFYGLYGYKNDSQDMWYWNIDDAINNLKKCVFDRITRKKK